MPFKNEYAKAIFKRYQHAGCETWDKLATTLVDNVCGSILDKETKYNIARKIQQMKFIPGGRYLYYANRNERRFYQNCYLFKSQEDTKEDWVSTITKIQSALLTGGGIGNVYTSYRAKGLPLKRTGGTASGPIAVMEMANEIGRYISQGGSRRCLPKDSMVHTKDGLIPIQDVKVGMKVITTDGYKDVLGNIPQGIQKTVNIVTEIGNIECTPNHRVAVLTSPFGDYKWVESQDLKDGDRLYFLSKHIDGKIYQLPKNNNEAPRMAFTRKSIVIPDLDIDMAWFLGYLHGNGCVLIINDGDGKRHGRVSLSIPVERPSIIQKVQQQLSRFGIKVTISDGCGECKNVTASSTELALYLSQFKKPKTTIDIPEIIYNNTIDIRGAYLAGLFDADGSCKTRPLDAVVSVYPLFLEQIKRIYDSLGIVSYIKCNRRARGNWQSLYRVYIKGNKQTTLFNNFVGKYSLKYLHEQKSTTQYSYSLTAIMANQIEKLNADKKANVSIEKIERNIGKQQYTPIKVMSVVDCREVDTYDISVADKNEFVVNGFIVHNSALWAGLHCYHPDAKEFLHIKDWDAQKVGTTGYTVGDMKRDDFAYKASLDCTNISLIYDKPEHLETDIFLENCVMALKNGEPGFSFNFDDPEESLRNAPLSADTLILIKDDNDNIQTITIRESLGKRVKLWTGLGWACDVVFKITKKEAEIVSVMYELHNSGKIHTIKADPSHEFIIERNEKDLLVRDMLYNNLHDKSYRVKANMLSIGDRLLVSNPGEKPSYATVVELVGGTPEDVYCADVKLSEHSFWANGVIVSNCTEVTSADDHDVCNIGSVNMARIVSLEDMLETSRLGSLFLYCGTITGSVPTEAIDIVRNKNRRIGLGLMGIHEWLIRKQYRYEMNPELRNYLMSYEVGSEHCKYLADKLGLPRPIKYRAIAPTGTIGSLASTSTGCEPIFAKAYVRKYAIDIDKYHYQYVIDPIVKELVNEGISPDKIETALELSNDIERRIKFQFELQKYIDQGISSCLSEKESMIQTDRGLFLIEELIDSKTTKEGFTGLLHDVSSVNIHNNLTAISQGFINGNKTCLRISCPGLKEIVCTPNHKIAILSSNYDIVWRLAKDIKVNDYIVSRKGLNLFNYQANKILISSLLGSKFVPSCSTNTKKINIPQHSSKSLCRLLGYLTSDGSVCKNGISLCQLAENDNVVDDFISIVKQLFNIEHHNIQKDKRSTKELVNVVINSRVLRDFMKYLGITNHNDVSVPKIVRLSPKSSVIEYIRGLTLDGYVSDYLIGVMTSSSLILLKQVQLMLLNMGIVACINKTNNAGTVREFPQRAYATRDCWVLSISSGYYIDKYTRLIGFIEQDKQAKAELLSKRKSRKDLIGEIPDFGLRSSFRENILPNLKSNRYYNYWHSCTSKSHLGMGISRVILQEMLDMGYNNIPSILLDDTYSFDKVLDINTTDGVETYDLSVPDGNSYIANSFIVHNTLNLPPTGSIDVHLFANILKKYASGLRGITVYPDGARGGQPLQSVDYYEAEKNQGKIYESYNACKDGVCGS